MADLAVIEKLFSPTGRAPLGGSRTRLVGLPSASRCAAALAAALIMAVFASIAAAHEMNIFVQRVEGAAIHGRVYFKGGAAAQGVAVRATDPLGNSLGETTTDADGQFVFVAKTGCDHLLSAELDDGHATRRPALVRRAQLPPDLPGPAASPAPPQPAAPAKPSVEGEPAAAVDPPSAVKSDSPPEPNPSRALPSDSSPRAAGAPGQPLGRDQSAASIAAQLDDIRERLERMETAVRWRDLLGGVGYILGAAGIAFYLMARRPSQGSAR